jgi:hypothetical protein
MRGGRRAGRVDGRPPSVSSRFSAASAKATLRRVGGVPAYLLGDIGDGAHTWLVEAAATGATRVRAKMARAVEFAAVLGADTVDQALGLAAAAGRFDEHDLGSNLDHLARRGDPGDLVHVDETHSAHPGTSSWGRLGQ